MFVFVLFEKNTENEVCVRERHFHWWARDREVARTGVGVPCSPAMSDGTCEAAFACRIMRARHSSANSKVVSGTADAIKIFHWKREPNNIFPQVS